MLWHSPHQRQPVDGQTQPGPMWCRQDPTSPNESTTSQCPRCSHPTETTPHVMRCRGLESDMIWSKSLKRLALFLYRSDQYRSRAHCHPPRRPPVLAFRQPSTVPFHQPPPPHCLGISMGHRLGEQHPQGFPLCSLGSDSSPLSTIREPKSMNLEIISKGFLQMPLKKFASLVKFFIRNLHLFSLVVTKFSLVSSNITLGKIKSLRDHLSLVGTTFIMPSTTSHRIVRRVTRHSAGMVCTTSGWPCLPTTPS